MTLVKIDVSLIISKGAPVDFIDHSPKRTFGVANMGHWQLFNNVVMLTKGAKEKKDDRSN